MYANDNVTQSNSKSQLTRRSFLAALPGFGLLAGAGLVATQAALAVLTPGETVECMDCHQVMSLASSSAHVCPYVPPVDFPDAARAAVIGQWEHKLDRVMTSLESLWGFLHQARTLPPADVDGAQFLGLELAAFNQVGQLSADMETNEFEALIHAMTGRKAIFWCLAEQIESGGDSPVPGTGEVDLLSEINALAEDDPAAAGELLALLQAAR